MNFKQGLQGFYENTTGRRLILNIVALAVIIYCLLEFTGGYFREEIGVYLQRLLGYPI